jgi:hypothetical protein
MQISGPAGPLATQKAQTASAAGFFAAQPEAPTGAKAEFLKRAQMTFAEQMRAQVLEALGVSEDELKAMSAEEREAVEAKIRETIKAKVEESQREQTGLFVDVKV